MAAKVSGKSFEQLVVEILALAGDKTIAHTGAKN
jgi:hypothetical protein